jgi:HAMP domain-containing protein
MLLMLAIVLLAFAGIVALAIARSRLGGPLRELSQLAATVGTGDFSQRISRARMPSVAWAWR